MSSYVEPRVDEHMHGSVVEWSLSGDWTRDLPMDVRWSASSRLAQHMEAALVLNLTDVRFIDSWAEELLADAIQAVRDRGYRVALVIDGTRRADFEGVTHVVERRGLAVGCFDQVPNALASIGGAQ